ncbi:hypothetical protein HDV00_010946 [Rhizophlyctis rosea]|nr:hypothetical protein HDV00_010946 [Rhizophlyctis rosea]
MDDRAMNDAVNSIAPWGPSPIVRLPAGDSWMIKRVLDTGAHGIVIPMVNTKAQAEAIVKAARFPPLGNRGHGGPFCTAAWKCNNAQYVNSANDEIMVVVQIETREGLDNVEEIAAVPGIDMLFVGPNDLAADLGFPPSSENYSPKVVAALDRIKTAARAHGKYVGIWANDGASAARRCQQGFQMVSIGADIIGMSGWYATEIAIAKGLRKPVDVETASDSGTASSPAISETSFHIPDTSPQEGLQLMGFETFDVRFPTSLKKDGSDAMNKDSDYSAAYIILKTSEHSLSGHGLAFTLGRGNDVQVSAIRAVAAKLVNRPLDELINDMGKTYKELTHDSQLRWLGPEKGAIHMGASAVLNALWDLKAKVSGKPLWKLITDMTPEEVVSLIDFRYIEDALTPEEALSILKEQEKTKVSRVDLLTKEGYPAYTTSAGWLGYSDTKIRTLIAEAKAQGFTHFKQKVGGNLQDDIRRAALIRSVAGNDATLMMDANQVWGVQEAIDNMQELVKFKPLWIEEPTSPDDILGHAKIRQALYPHTKIATGEHIQNRIVFKQLLQLDAIDFVQIDACRLCSVNECISVMLLAKKFGKKIVPHAGGVGLCEYVQHLSMIDYAIISGTLQICEYVNHLHEHFVHPCIIQNGKYVAPTDPGYSIEMKRESLVKWSFPSGEKWRK